MEKLIRDGKVAVVLSTNDTFWECDALRFEKELGEAVDAKDIQAMNRRLL